MKRIPGFGENTERKIPYKDLAEKDVVITTDNGDIKAGKYVGYCDGDIVLNPYVGTEFNEIFGRRLLLAENLYVQASSIKSIEPATRESLENFCTVTNTSSERMGLEEIRKLTEERKRHDLKPDNSPNNLQKFLRKFLQR
ncbi:MAG: hypothetical protein ABIH49_00230 [archaeon]